MSLKGLVGRESLAEILDDGLKFRIGALGAEVIVAGGIANLAHVRGCAAASGVAGVVVGKPLLLGKFTLKQALEIAATGLKDRK